MYIATVFLSEERILAMQPHAAILSEPDNKHSPPQGVIVW